MRVVDRHLARQQRLAEHAVGIAAPVRRAAGACLADWRTAPAEKWDELFDVYDLALSRVSFPAQRAEADLFVRDIKAVKNPEASPGLADVGPALRADLARAQRLFRPPIPVCEIVRDTFCG